MNKTLGIAIVIILLIVAGVYLWGGKKDVSVSTESQTAAVMQATSSDEVSDIEADLNFEVN